MNIRDHAKRILLRIEKIWAEEPSQMADQHLVDVHCLASAVLDQTEKLV